MARKASATGRRVTSNGYINIWAPAHPLARTDGYVLEHRMVVFDAGIPVPAGYDVHHLNESRTDNRLENLEVLEHGAHKSHHLTEAGKVENQFGVFPVAKTQAERLANVAARVGHGHVQTYGQGCRCDACGTAHRDRHRREALVRITAKRADRYCAHCGEPMPFERRTDAIFCSRTCTDRAKVVRNIAADPTTWPHGKLSCYTNYRCRCDACLEVARAYRTRRVA